MGVTVNGYDDDNDDDRDGMRESGGPSRVGFIGGHSRCGDRKGVIRVDKESSCRT